MRRRLPRWPLLLCFLAVALPAFAADGEPTDPSATLVAVLAVIILSAKLGGEIAVRLRQPSVLGELVMGVVLGNLHLVGLDSLSRIAHDPLVDILARLGVLLLLFEVGLQSTVKQMLKVGLSSLLVALAGVIAPFALGWLVSAWLLPTHSMFVHLFIGATLTATSVGITARVLQDLGRSDSDEARVILGAAVIDDVLGLVILAVVTGVIVGGTNAVSVGAISLVVSKAVGFLAVSLVLGLYLSPRFFQIASHLRSRGVLLAVGLAFCFTMAWLASVIGLAPIVGAFAAGLVLEDVHYRDFTSRGESTLGNLIQPISSFLVPIFFVLMGMRTELESFARPGVLGLAAALTFVAIVGKQVCGLAVVDGKLHRLSIGIGMIPRGEVGLIFANIGLTLQIDGKRIVDAPVFSAIVLVVIVTTLVTPPALKWSFARVPRPDTPPG